MNPDKHKVEDKAERSVSSGSVGGERRDASAQDPAGLDQQRLMLEQQRLELERERLRIDKYKERSTRILTFLPVLVGILALMLNGFLEYQKSKSQEQMDFEKLRLEYEKIADEADKAGKTELFKKLVEKSKNREEIIQVYEEVFPSKPRNNRQFQPAVFDHWQRLQRAGELS